jgi:hypothetical protein
VEGSSVIKDLTITGRAAEQLEKAKERYRKAVADVDRRAQEMRGCRLKHKVSGRIFQCCGLWPDETHAISVYPIKREKDDMSSGSWRANPCEFEIVESE